VSDITEWAAAIRALPQHPATGDDMATNSDGAQPNPGDQQQPDPAAVAAAAALAAGQQPPKEPEPTVIDQDEQDVLDAKAAVEAEKAAVGKDDVAIVEPEKTPGQQQPDATKDQVQQPAAAGEQHMIPKARLDEALAKASQAESERAYWKGVADARAQGQPQPQPGQQQPGAQQQQQPTADQRLSTIQAEQDALATKYDNGEISYSDLTKQQRDLSNKEFAIREELLVAKVGPAQKPAEQGTDQLYLDTLTAQLEQEHPWVGVFDAVGTDNDWNYLKGHAVENLVARGIDPTKGSIGRYELRKEVATLADQLGPGLVADRAKAKGIAIPGQTPSPGGQQQPNKLSPQAQAREAKLGKAADAPPNLNAMGGLAVDGAGIPSDARLEAMDDEEIGNLPDATRKRLLGTT
jgi:hypothetical protein